MSIAVTIKNQSIRVTLKNDFVRISFLETNTLQTINASSGGGTWGSITGTLSNQTDLQAALNLKATVASVALKADIASPALTGNPTAPTQSQGDNSTNLATTAYVDTGLSGKLSTGLARLLTGTNTFTGAVTDVGTTTNTYKYQVAGLGVTTTNVWMLENTTAAAAGVQQISPPFVQRGRGWATNSGGSSQTVDFYQYVLPVQGTANPTGSWNLSASINGGALVNYFNVTNEIIAGNGILQINGNYTNASTSSGQFWFQGAVPKMNIGGSVQTLYYGPALATLGQIVFIAGGSPGQVTAGSSLTYTSSTLAVTGAITATTSATITVATPAVSLFRGTASGVPTIDLATFHAGSTITLRNTTAARYFSFLNGDAVTTGNTNQLIYGALVSTSLTSNNTGAILYGYSFSPTIAGSQQPTVVSYHHTMGYVQWASVLTPSQITSNQNDYNPTGLTNGGVPYGASQLRLDTDASRDITGIVGGVEGRVLTIINVGAQNIVLKDDVTSTAANRFQLNADLTILPEQAVMLIYDGTSSRWRALKTG